MSRKSVLIILIVIGILGLNSLGFYIRPVKAIIWIEGHITSDTTWSPVDTYRVINNTYVDSEVTLTILPGVTVQFADGFSLLANGSLNATGTEANPIVFTSSRVAQNPPSPYPGAWNTIRFEGSIDERCLIKYAEVEYAVQGITIASLGSATIEHSHIFNCSESSTCVVGESNVVIKENLFEQNKNGVDTPNEGAHSGIQIVGNRIISNSENGIRLRRKGIWGPFRTSNISITSNVILSNRANGICVDDDITEYGAHHYIFDITVSFNTISSNGGHGIYLNGHSSGGYCHIYSVIIASNNITLNQGAGIHISGFSGGTCDVLDIIVSLNSISLNGNNGITVSSTSTNYPSYMHNVSISFNTILSNKANAIHLECEDHIYDILVLSNLISSNIGDGIYVHTPGLGPWPENIYNVTFISNSISSQLENGIYLSITYFGPGVKPTYVFTICNNTISANHQKGLWIYGDVNSNLTRNSISYNQYGVLYTSNHGNRANYNDVYSNKYGINVTNGATVNAEHNYWGDPTGPYQPSLNPEGQGDPVNGDGTDLDFIPFLTSPVGTINERPVAILEADKTSPMFNETVTFDATGSTDDGRIDYYFFDFGDGINSGWITLPVVTHKYAEEGTYNATLIVIDDFGVTSLDGGLVYVTITVVPEFPSSLVLSLFMTATLLAVIVHKRKCRISLRDKHTNFRDK